MVLVLVQYSYISGLSFGTAVSIITLKYFFNHIHGEGQLESSKSSRCREEKLASGDRGRDGDTSSGALSVVPSAE